MPAPMLSPEELCERGLEVCVGAPPIVLEIGFGRAEVLMALAAAEPEKSFLGVEVRRTRAWKAALRVERAGLPRVRLVHASAELLLERVLPDRSIAECWINFPDPWPKKRHHKRRLIRASALEQLARVLEPGGALHIATDHSGYAEWIACALAAAASFQNEHAPKPWSSEPPPRPVSAYEAEFRAEGRAIAYFEYRRRRP